MKILQDNWVQIPLDKLVKAEWNYKEEDEFLSERLKENIKRNGQIENIIIRELDTGYYEVVNGNHRYDVMKDLGHKEIIAYNLGKINEESAIRKAIETNETKFTVNQITYSKLLKQLNEMYPIEDLAKTIPISEEEIKKHIDSLNFDWDQFKEKDEFSEKEGFIDIKLSLPEAIAEQFNYQLNRIKTALYPDQKIQDISNVIPIECMIQHIAQIPDDQLI